MLGDGDGEVTVADRDSLIADVFGTVAGDTDLDGDVDFGDFLAMSDAFGTTGGGLGAGDYDGNGVTEFADFLAMSTNFTGIAAAAQSVPEPNSGMLWLLAAVALMGARRSKSR